MVRNFPGSPIILENRKNSLVGQLEKQISQLTADVAECEAKVKAMRDDNEQQHMVGIVCDTQKPCLCYI